MHGKESQCCSSWRFQGVVDLNDPSSAWLSIWSTADTQNTRLALYDGLRSHILCISDMKLRALLLYHRRQIWRTTKETPQLPGGWYLSRYPWHGCNSSVGSLPGQPQTALFCCGTLTNLLFCHKRLLDATYGAFIAYSRALVYKSGEAETKAFAISDAGPLWVKVTTNILTTGCSIA